MPLLTEIRDAAVASLRQSLPEAGRVEAFCGSIDFDRIAPRGLQYSEKAALFVAIGECRNVGKALDLDCEISLWAFSLCRHASRPTVAAGNALELAQKAALAIHGQIFGLVGATAASVRHVRPVVDAEMEKAGIHAWELMWTMRACLEASR